MIPVPGALYPNASLPNYDLETTIYAADRTALLVVDPYSDFMRDATGAFEQEGRHAAHAVNGPRFAHAILTTEKLLALLPAAQERRAA